MSKVLQGEHSAIRSTFIKLPFVIKNIVLSYFEWPFYTGFTVLAYFKDKMKKAEIIIFAKACCRHCHPTRICGLNPFKPNGISLSYRYDQEIPQSHTADQPTPS